jgi:hypothetical protein
MQILPGSSDNLTLINASRTFCNISVSDIPRPFEGPDSIIYRHNTTTATLRNNLSRFSVGKVSKPTRRVEKPTDNTRWGW